MEQIYGYKNHPRCLIYPIKKTCTNTELFRHSENKINIEINISFLKINKEIYSLQNITLLKNELKPLLKISNLIKSYKKDLKDSFDNLEKINLYVLKII